MSHRGQRNRIQPVAKGGSPVRLEASAHCHQCAVTGVRVGMCPQDGRSMAGSTNWKPGSPSMCVTPKSQCPQPWGQQTGDKNILLVLAQCKPAEPSHI